MYQLPQSACRHRRGADIGQLAGIAPRHRDDHQVELRISLNSVERWADGTGSFRGRAGATSSVLTTICPSGAVGRGWALRMGRFSSAGQAVLAAVSASGPMSAIPVWLHGEGVLITAARTAGRSPHLPCRVTHTGVAYLLLPQGPATLACVSGPLLLVFMTGTGIVLGTAGSTVPA